MRRYSIHELIDIDNLRELMNRFYKATGIPVGVIDTEDKILVATGWQDICVRFHRCHPETLERCRQSDAYIRDNIHVDDYIEYRCKNGLWDLAVPLVIDGEHLATLFLGQFFYADDVPDRDFFRRQAREIGFDEESYLAALDDVPVFTREKVTSIMEYYVSFVRFLMQTGLTNLKRIETEKALRSSEERYRAIFEQSPDAIAIMDPESLKYVDFNTVAHARLGYTREEFAELTLFDIVDGFSPEKFAEASRMLEKEGSATFEFRDRTKTGELRDVLVTVRLLTIDGRPMGHSVVKDITERKKMQEELLKAQKLESLGILAGGIAHDFNNILTGIQGNLSIVQMLLPANGKVSERIHSCEKAVRQATGLTRQLLTFARGGDPVKKIINPQQIIKDSVSFALRGSNVIGISVIADDLWPIEVDEGQISQVINNLLINADQAMPGGGVVHVMADNRRLTKGEIPPLAPGDYVRISIADQGNGIPAEHLDRIFDPYFTTKKAGTGLGLTSLYSIVRKHEGQVQVTSDAGKGARFDVYLPARPGFVVPEEDLPEQSASGGAKGFILVMDDERAIRDVAGEILSLLGYKVETCVNGEELIARYKSALAAGSRPDAVIMDLTIPGGMGGLEAASAILAIDPAAKLIVSSGYSNDSVLANFRNYGFTDSLVKPFRVEDLGATLDRLLEQN